MPGPGIPKRKETKKMRRLILAGLVISSLSGVAGAKDKPVFEKGLLLRMDSSSCGYAEKDGKTLAGQILGTDGQHKNTKEVLCQEYVLQSDRLVYRIRPKDDKHPALLPVGESAEFRIHKDKMILRVPESDDKEREYLVISMTPRADAVENHKTSAQASPR
jgi:hypothetical protein